MPTILILRMNIKESENENRTEKKIIIFVAEQRAAPQHEFQMGSRTQNVRVRVSHTFFSSLFSYLYFSIINRSTFY